MIENHENGIKLQTAIASINSVKVHQAPNGTIPILWSFIYLYQLKSEAQYVERGCVR